MSGYRIVYDYDHVPTIRKFAMDDHRIRALMGCFGSGKSSGCVMEIIRKAHEQVPSPDGIRRTRWAVIRNTAKQLNDTTIRTFHDWFPPSIFGEWLETKHNYIITRFPGVHLEVMFRALDRPDQVSNLLSLELTGAWFNEVRECNRAIFMAMDGRIGRFPAEKDGGCTWHGIIMDTNPPDEDSWFFRYFEKQRPPNAILFKQPSGLSMHAENIQNLPRGYYKNLAIGKDEQYVRVYVHGQYGYLVDGKAVYQDYFKDNIHVASYPLEPIKDRPLLIGLDFGLTPACVIGQMTKRGQLLILEEFVSHGMGLKQFLTNVLIPHLRVAYRGYDIMGYGDPAGTARSPTDESTCFDILNSHDIGLNNVLPADTNALLARVGAVKDLLSKMVDGEPGFILSPVCDVLRKGFNGGYALKKIPGQEDQYSDKPEKNDYSHVHDALQYLALFAGNKEARDIRVKEFERMRKVAQYRPASRLAGY